MCPIENVLRRELKPKQQKGHCDVLETKIDGKCFKYNKIDTVCEMQEQDSQHEGLQSQQERRC